MTKRGHVEGSEEALDESALIERYFAPLCTDEGACLLRDDVAYLGDVVISTDHYEEGRHFPSGDFSLIAQHCFCAAMADIVAKGATPLGFFVNCVWSARCGVADVAAFASGLTRMSRRYAAGLLGGDTCVSPGKASHFSFTVLGAHPSEKKLCPANCRPGDLIWQLGRIGGAGAWLLEKDAPRSRDKARLALAFYRPRLWTDFRYLIDLVGAATDISDGLVAECARMARLSGCDIKIEATALKICPTARKYFARLEKEDDALGVVARAATAGDDYQIVFCAAPETEAALRRRAALWRLPIAPIGRACKPEAAKGECHLLGPDARPLALSQTGYVHRLGS